MHHPTDRITHTTAFVTPVVEHWLKKLYLFSLIKTWLIGSINIKHEFVNWIIVNVKFYIYRTKLQKKILYKIGIKNTLIVIRDKLQMLKYIFYKKTAFIRNLMKTGHHGKYFLNT